MKDVTLCSDSKTSVLKRILSKVWKETREVYEYLRKKISLRSDRITDKYSFKTIKNMNLEFERRAHINLASGPPK